MGDLALQSALIPGEFRGRPDRLILSQAAQADGATTIPQGSTLKRAEAPGPTSVGEDIVSTFGESKAARKGGSDLARRYEGYRQATISWDLVAKARQPGSAQSFENAMTQVVDNTLLSHRRHQTADLLYGGDDIGIIKTGVASATQTITSASCAPGIFYGSANMLCDLYDVTLATKRNASPLSIVSYNVDPTGANRTITFNSSVTSTTGDRLVFAGTVASQAFVTPPGLSIVAGQTGGNLFGLNQVSYPVFAGSQYDAGNAALTMQKIDAATILPLIRGFNGRMKLLVHPLTFSNIAMEEVARINLVGSQAKGTAEVGYDTVRFITAAGANVECQPSPWVKEGLGFIVPMDGSCKRIGAVDIQLGGPADPQPTWRRIEGQTGYSLPTYSLQALFTPEPWKLVLIKNITNT